LDLGKFGNAMQQNALFRGLVKEFPDWHPYEIIEIDFSGNIDFYSMNVAGYDQKGGDEDEDGDVEEGMDMGTLAKSLRTLDVDNLISDVLNLEGDLQGFSI
jgi:hypothetical protein